MFYQDTHKVEEEEEKRCLKESLMLNPKPSQVKNLMHRKYNKTGISMSHVRYMMQKLKEPDTERQDLAVFLEEIEEEGGKVEIMLDKDKVRVLTVQTTQMRRAFLGVNPDTVLVDTTFSFNKNGYKMSAFAYCNPVSNKGELAQLTFMSDEGGDAVEFAFKAFRKSILKDPRCIMLDKDFTANHTLAKVFPNSTTLLCLFHTLKWWKSLVNTARAAAMEEVPVDIAKKEAIMECFRAVVYAASNEDSEDKMRKFEEEIFGVEVRVGNGDKGYYVDVLTYK